MAREKTMSVADRLLAALEKVDRPGTFATSGTAPAVLPGLEVEGLGAIGLPLSAAQAKAMKKRCEQAPYGKGEQTLVDTSVRKVWRLTPKQFAITNPAWEDVLKGMVTKVQADLGLQGQQLRPHLYDLLLYEKGGFFLPHRDGEKLDRMVATLVVVLPSKHEGGELVVRHEGREQAIDFGGPDARFQTRYAAFYADCEHEVKPLRSGYRLCLVYNLTLEKPKSKKPVGAPQTREHVSKVAEVLRDWAEDPGGPEKLAVTLEHQYTQEGLAWDALKGVDAARSEVLTEAARQAGGHAYLALLTFWESGSAEYAGGSGRRGWGRYGDYDDEPDDYEMGEIFDSSLTADHWRSPDGGRPPFGAMPIQREEVVPEDSLTAVEPEEDFEGYTGNAGLTIDRWYRHGVIVLWPDERHLDVLCAGGARQAVPALARMVSAWRRARKADAAAMKQRCVALAAKILDRWPEARYRGWHEPEPRSPDAADPMPLLRRLEDPGLIGTYLRDVLPRDATLEPGKGTVPAVERHGWATFRPDLVALFRATTGETIERNVRLLERLCQAAARRAGKRDGAEAAETCRRAAEAVVEALVRDDAGSAAVDYRARPIGRASMLARLTRALLAARTDDLLARVVAHVRTHRAKYPLRDVQVPALVQVGEWARQHPDQPSPALSQWLEACRAELESLTAAAPKPPADFRREAAVKCKCADCAQLNGFLADPEERERGFQVAQIRRDHLANNIRTAGCDLTLATDRRPRPQVLVCTKNTASYERRLKEYDENLEHLAALRSIEANLPH